MSFEQGVTTRKKIASPHLLWSLQECWLNLSFSWINIAGQYFPITLLDSPRNPSNYGSAHNPNLQIAPEDQNSSNHYFKTNAGEQFTESLIDELIK